MYLSKKKKKKRSYIHALFNFLPTVRLELLCKAERLLAHKIAGWSSELQVFHRIINVGNSTVLKAGIGELLKGPHEATSSLPFFLNSSIFALALVLLQVLLFKNCWLFFMYIAAATDWVCQPMKAPSVCVL